MGRSGGFTAPPGFRDSATRTLNIGDVVGSMYTIRSELAASETGVVYEARDMLLDRPVALKLAWRDPGLPPLLLEARRCAAVRDSCSVAIYGMGSHHGIEYIVGERVSGPLLARLLVPLPPPGDYLARLRRLVAAVARAHEARVGIGEISGGTVVVEPDGRIIFGALSLSQVPALGPVGRVVAPEVVRGDVAAADPSASQAIDLYALGCAAVELATGRPPFASAASELVLRGHAQEPPPRLSAVRPDLPDELSDLVEWLLDKQPAARPSSARDVLAQLDVILEREEPMPRPMRVLVIDHDLDRRRWLSSLARRGHAAVHVDVASTGGGTGGGDDAARRLDRDLPDLVLVSAGLRGEMNAYELCMYARGVEAEHPPQLVVIGEPAERDRALFEAAGVPCIADDTGLGAAVLERVRAAVREPPRRRRSRSTISG